VVDVVQERGKFRSEELYSREYYRNIVRTLDSDTLDLLLVQVDKENLIEFPFNCGTLLIYALCLLLFISSYVSLLSCSFSHVY